MIDQSDPETILAAAAVLSPQLLFEHIEDIPELFFRDPAMACVCHVFVEAAFAGLHLAKAVETFKARGRWGGDIDSKLIGLLSQCVVSPVIVADAVGKVRRSWQLRQLRSKLNLALASAGDEAADPFEVIAGLEADLAGIASSGAVERVVSINDAVEAVLDGHEAKLNGDDEGFTSTGFSELDRRVAGGFRPKSLWLLAGYSFAGKTALAVSMMLNVCTRQGRVLFISLELDASEVAERAMASWLGIEYRAFAHEGLSREEIARCRREMREAGFGVWEISQSPNETIESIRALALRFKAIHGKPHLVVIDHLQFIDCDGDRDARYSRLLTLTKKLKVLARDLETTVLCLCQLGAERFDSDGKIIEPNESDLAESKGTKRNADVLVLMHRETKTCEKTLLKIEKARRGTQSRMHLYFDGPIQRFSEAPRADDF